MPQPGAPVLRSDEIAAALNHSAAFRALPIDQQEEMAGAMGRVFGYLGAPPARPFAPDLNALRGGGAGGGGAMPSRGGPPAPARSRRRARRLRAPRPAPARTPSSALRAPRARCSAPSPSPISRPR